MTNLCYPTLVNQATPREFGPLWNPCKLPEKIKDAIDEAHTCHGQEYEETLDCVQEAADEAGLKYVGAGIHRAGFQFNGCVIKIALNDEGLKANEGEYEAWRQIGTHYKSVFAPVHDHAQEAPEFLWITQPRLVPVAEFDKSKRKLLRDRLREKMARRGLDCGHDVEPHNIGVKQRGFAPFLFDYGFGTKCTLKTPSGERVIEVRGGDFP